jgi:hypothetical protein
MRLYLYICDECGAMTAANGSPDTQPGYRCKLVRQYDEALNDTVTCPGTVRYVGAIDLQDETIDDIVDILAPTENKLANVIRDELVPRPNEDTDPEPLPPWLR